ISVAAGEFSDLQQAHILKWIEMQNHLSNTEDYFICNIVGESMNKKIPNGSLCLFRKYFGGSRKGEIVLAQRQDIQDSDFGAGFTIKLYSSEKEETEDTWKHKLITLKPFSN